MKGTNRRKLSDRYNLAYLYPDLAKEWHPFKNLNLGPADVTPGSSKIVWWMCQHGHEWRAKVNHRKNGAGCRYCKINKVDASKNFETCYPELMREWCYELNGDVSPSLLSPNSGKKVWWECSTCGYRWKTSVQHRTKNRGCKRCKAAELSKRYKGKTQRQRKLLKDEYPNLAAEWHPTKNDHLDLSKITSGSSKIQVWWKCQTCGHEWSSTISSRTNNGSGCPQCKIFRTRPGYNLETLFPELIEEWDYHKNSPITPNMVAPKSEREVWWICRQCLFSWKAKVRHRTVQKSGCPRCPK